MYYAYIYSFNEPFEDAVQFMSCAVDAGALEGREARWFADEESLALVKQRHPKATNVAVYQRRVITKQRYERLVRKEASV